MKEPKFNLVNRLRNCGVIEKHQRDIFDYSLATAIVFMFTGLLVQGLTDHPIWPLIFYMIGIMAMIVGVCFAYL